ncbi:MAG TPA: condensation domain-containing protein, partial [Chitinophaga sp.]|uniref:condensation domain-containing protein n=1 Tax=Chitinophaga sp. TaxID=1869181 RepID=UPI002DBF20C4
MDQNQFLTSLRKLNIIVRLDDDGNLDVEGARNALTPEILEQIKEWKNGLVSYLKSIKEHTVTSKDIPVAPVQDSYPLSSSQMRLWLLQAANKGSVAYHISNTLPFTGELDPSKYGQAIKAVVARHEILRTVFREESGGVVRQVVLPADAVNVKLAYVDLRGDKQGRKTAERMIEEDSRRPFDLSTGPLFRIMLFRLDEAQHLFYYNMHHIISDGWSMNVLSRDVLHFYELYTNGGDATMPLLPLQYKDYAVWEQEQLATAAYSRHHAYWLEQLSGELPVRSLPSDKIRPAVMKQDGYGLSTFLGRELTDKLLKLCQDRQGTLFIGLSALLKALFYRYTGQEDIIIGSPVAGRDHADLEDQIGFYVNTLALRTQFSGADSFIELLDRERDVLLGAYEHQSYPFDRLVEDLDVRRDMSRSAIFDVMLVLQNQQAQDRNTTGISQPEEIREEGPCAVKFDLLIEFNEAAEGLQLFVQYNTGVYDKGH